MASETGAKAPEDRAAIDLGVTGPGLPGAGAWLEDGVEAGSETAEGIAGELTGRFTSDSGGHPGREPTGIHKVGVHLDAETSVADYAVG
jgi:hypothetical protein